MKNFEDYIVGIDLTQTVKEIKQTLEINEIKLNKDIYLIKEQADMIWVDVGSKNV